MVGREFAPLLFGIRLQGIHFFLAMSLRLLRRMKALQLAAGQDQALVDPGTVES